MKILVLLSVFLTVALGMPFEAKEAQAPVAGADQSLLVGELLPVQGHVVVENPAPQLTLDAKKEPAPLQEDGKQKKEEVVFDQTQVKDNQDLPESPRNTEQETEPMAPVKEESELPVENMEPDIKNTKTEEIQDINNKFQIQIELLEEREPSQELAETHTDTEGTYKMMEQPIMKLEPLADEEVHSDELLDTEKTEGDTENNAVMFGEPIMFLEPEIVEDHFVNEQILPNTVSMEDEGPMLDALGEPMQPLEGYYPYNEDFVGLEPDTEQQIEKMGIQAIVGEKESHMSVFMEPLIHDKGGRWCGGVVLGGKCYQFFQSPKKAADAEFFCQERFPGGHLASITSPVIHNEMMNLMQQNGGYRRTWVGGLRFLDSGRFIWLDGSHWGYADWLQGEPNNTSNLENCLEVLASGKFNDFTCWEPQAFICSYPYQ